MHLKYRKFAVMGFRGVGKTSLITQFVERQFNDSYDPTIADTYGKTIKVEGQLYRINLVDTQGLDTDTPHIPQNYCMNIDGWILVYSITSEKSFQAIQNIYSKLKDNMGPTVKLPVVLVGNKSDLSSSRAITHEMGVELAARWGCTHIQSSARLNTELLKNMSMESVLMYVSDIFTSIVQRHEKMNTPKRKKRRFCFCI